MTQPPDWSLVFDPLFRLPLITALLLSVTLPVVGAYLLLRREWLAALGLSHLAAAGVMAGSVLGIPPLVGGLTASGGGALLKGRFFTGNTSYGVMILLGYSLTLLLAANTAHGMEQGRSLMEGQLYFTNTVHAAGAGVLIPMTLAAVFWAGPKLLAERFFPDHFTANGQAVWHRVAFDLTAAAALTLGTASMGVMATFALVFAVPLMVFWSVTGWHRALWMGATMGLMLTTAAFVAALALDQPFGPVLVALVLLALPFWRLARRFS